MKRLSEAIDRVRTFLEHVAHHRKVLVLLIVLLLVLSVENPPPTSMEARVDRQLTGRQFDFVT